MCLKTSYFIGKLQLLGHWKFGENGKKWKKRNYFG